MCMPEKSIMGLPTWATLNLTPQTHSVRFLGGSLDAELAMALKLVAFKDGTGNLQIKVKLNSPADNFLQSVCTEGGPGGHLTVRDNKLGVSLLESPNGFIRSWRPGLVSRIGPGFECGWAREWFIFFTEGRSQGQSFSSTILKEALK